MKYTKKPKNAKAPKKSLGSRVLNAYGETGALGGVFDGGSMGTLSPMSMPFQLAGDTQYAPVTLNRVLLNYSYMTFGVIQTVIDQPVEDAFRGGIEIDCDELDAEDIQDLQDYLERNKIIHRVKQAIKWSRLFGGSGLIINTNQDPTTELDKETIGQDSPLDFIDADRWELVLQYITETECPFNYYGQKIHKSRVIKLLGKEAPSFVRKRLQGWGMSEIERLVRSLNSYTKHGDVIFELIDEAKIDVFGIEGYNASLLSGNARAAIDSRLRDVSMGKNYHNALVIDKEDSYEQKQLTFSGMAEILKEIRIAIACEAKMPMTKLFGLSASGFSSGEDDIENYNSMVEGETRATAREILIHVLPLCFRKLFGFEPQHWTMKFKALRVLSSLDEENIKSQKHARYEADYNKGMLSAQEYAEIQKREGLLIMDTEVLKGGEPLPPINPFMEGQGQEEGQEGQESPKSGKHEAPEGKPGKEGKDE